MAKTLYEVIGVEPTATREEIEIACLKRGELYRHGANSENQKAKWKFSEIDQAYEILLDPIKRRDYDDQLFGSRHRPDEGKKLYRLYVPLAILAITLPLALIKNSGKESKQISTVPIERGTYRASQHVDREEERAEPVTTKQRETENRIRLRQALEGNPISAKEAEILRRGAESIVENDRRRADERKRLGLEE